ncbi:AAA domain protein [Acinetobacter baumannii Naval-72]|uniref:ATP-dependent nuclease n=1 Tax=Acinetobacter baumannii TaxID=470 RepID=UPI00028E74CC|nr:ATP-dependent endonuclease [Acinetobacter baumannii]EKK11452.1 AAA domain protein [Acinetobacter baumannii Naval-72]
MKLKKITIQNFRRLENVTIDIEDKETIFVGPNNSGKTSATAIFKCFLGGTDFKIYDISASRVADFESFLHSNDPSLLPEIILDLWFSIDPNTIAFGRVFTLLPHLSDFTEVGLRMSYTIENPIKLREDYEAAYPIEQTGNRAKSLFQFLAIDKKLNHYFSTNYYSLEKDENENSEIIETATLLDRNDAKKLVSQLIKVEFVDAQRNINDDDSNRSNRLSTAFASFYKKNLEQSNYAAEAHEVINNNNKQLTAHYETQFSPLMTLIKGLGIPSVNDRELRIISSLSPESALRGNTELIYVDPNQGHDLPELYNGLGFKNLIYMAIQARHFHSQWLITPVNRPLCLLIFIEEPEVHLHAQVQQSFITNIWNVINESIASPDQAHLVPQIVVTTHSSHIIDAIDFEKVRYFQRSYTTRQTDQTGIQNVSNVMSLRSFQPQIITPEEGVQISPEESIAFLKKYLRLTHCDLFFSDAAILIEGAAEKLLLPSIIESSAHRLKSTYLTILEVGGAYAHRFEGLLEFLKIPYLVITDIDSIKPDGRSACRANIEGARTSNASLKHFYGIETIADLMAILPDNKIHKERDRCVAFQTEILVNHNNNQKNMLPRTLEEAIAYENFGLLHSGGLSIGIDIPDCLDSAYDQIYKRICSDSFKKTDFAMDLLARSSVWMPPKYIVDGLLWLETRLCGPTQILEIEQNTVTLAEVEQA